MNRMALSMLKNTIELFNILGFRVKVDASWLLIAALIVWNLSTAYFPDVLPGLERYDYIALSIIAMLGLFASLILHELSHSLVARHFGLEVGGITLFIFGGVAELEQEPKDPKTEFWIALAGPVMSVVIGLACYAILEVFRNENTLQNASASLFAVIGYLGLINLVLAAFNLLPAFPMDGGRILRAGLWKARNDLLWATRIASNMGVILAIMLIISGVFSLSANIGIGGFWQILIGFFILTASRGSYQQLIVTQALKDQKVEDLMSTDVITADADATIDSVVNEVILKHKVSFVPIVEGEEVLGYVDIDIIHKIELEHWNSTQVGDIYVKINSSNSIAPDMATEDVFKLMASTGQRKLLVTKDARLLGVLTLADLMNYLSIRQGLGIRPKNGAGFRAAPNSK